MVCLIEIKIKLILPSLLNAVRMCVYTLYNDNNNHNIIIIIQLSSRETTIVFDENKKK